MPTDGGGYGHREVTPWSGLATEGEGETMRRSTVLLLAAAALVMAACEIRTDYDMTIADDTSAMLAFEISYDAEAAQLFGPAEDFLEDEIEGDLASDIDGVTLVSAEADSSDPENQRVTAVFEARDGEAFDRLVADAFPRSSFISDDNTTWTLTLSPDDDVTEGFDEEFPLEELGLDFISGEVRIDHAGSQVSMTGGIAEGGNVVVWDPYGADGLEVVMDLSGASPPAAEDDEVEEPAEEPEEPVDEVEEEPADEVEEPAEEPEEEAPVAVIDIEDEGGMALSGLLLAAIIGGALLLLALVLLLVVLRGRGKDPEAAAAAAGTPVGTAAAAGAWDQRQAPTQQWEGTPPAAGQWDQTQPLGPTPQGTPQPPASAPPASAPPAPPSPPPDDRPQPPTPPPPPPSPGG
ncbi:MAG: hypothetical protein EA387_04570 [Nitriliruptor sp.]|nr:MAG: hypothetical protein EA387_04570 [Nitriliruptor sp.]